MASSWAIEKGSSILFMAKIHMDKLSYAKLIMAKIFMVNLN